MECNECGNTFYGTTCTHCGAVYEDRPISYDNNTYPHGNKKNADKYGNYNYSWSHLLSPNIRRNDKTFNPKYQKNYKDYVYIKAYELISKTCAGLCIPDIVKYEALNLFRGIRNLDEGFFKKNNVSPTCLACVKIACKIHDYPIMNHKLAEMIDYKLKKDPKNIAYMEKKFNRAFGAIIILYKLRINTPEHPRFIDYACDFLHLPFPFTVKIHTRYTILNKYFQSHYKLEGYILALIYIYGRQQYGITLKQLEDTFHISSRTINNRKIEITNIIRHYDDDKKM